MIAPEVDCPTKIVFAKATTDTQRSAIGQQTSGRVEFFLHSDDFTAQYNAMRAAGVFFEQAPREEPHGRVVVWQVPFGNRWDLLHRTDEYPALNGAAHLRNRSHRDKRRNQSDDGREEPQQRQTKNLNQNERRHPTINMPRCHLF